MFQKTQPFSRLLALEDWVEKLDRGDFSSIIDVVSQPNNGVLYLPLRANLDPPVECSLGSTATHQNVLPNLFKFKYTSIGNFISKLGIPDQRPTIPWRVTAQCVTPDLLRSLPASPVCIVGHTILLMQTPSCPFVSLTLRPM